ncbi:MAG TPA: ABC transporter substrate-binding protein [Terriglobales bacterium]|nr:ABC transporter substrate-binding protein [Terriglobales bacterium]
MIRYSILFLLSILWVVAGCSSRPDPKTVVMDIEFSPTNLDPRVGTDAQSEFIDELLFDSLVRKDQNFNLVPGAAERWEIPDPRTYIFHLRRGIRFHDGRPLTARDVKWTLDSMRDGSLRTIKGATYNLVDRVDMPDDFTLVVHLKEPFAPLLWNLSEGAFGIVPFGSGKDFKNNPIGSGPFRFVLSDPDSQVVIARNDNYWGERPRVERIRFAVIPDDTTRALELRKGSADLAPANSFPPDMVGTLAQQRNLVVQRHPGTSLAYLAFNLRDPILKDVRVRQAVAYAIDRQAILHYLLRDSGRLAANVLPPEHWAYDPGVTAYSYDPDKANSLLDAAGYPRGQDGIRLHLTMKTSTVESARLFASVLQQQLRVVGIDLHIRTYEFATFYSDVTKGAFQLYSLRWIGYSNQDPDIFEDAFHSASFAPKRANRGYYSNPEVDSLIEEGRRTVDVEQRKRIYARVQQILSHDLPYFNLWYLDNVLVHSSRVSNVALGASADYQFLNTVELAR